MSQFYADKPTILVLGNEGYGLRTNVLRKCDALVHIPSVCTGESYISSSEAVPVDSLNVSVAGGIMIQSISALLSTSPSVRK